MYMYICWLGPFIACLPVCLRFLMVVCLISKSLLLLSLDGMSQRESFLFMLDELLPFKVFSLSACFMCNTARTILPVQAKLGPICDGSGLYLL